MRADIYLLDSPHQLDLYTFVVKLCIKARSQSLTVAIHVADEADAQALSECMWSVDPESFIPHEVLSSHSEAPPGNNPILIDSRGTPVTPSDNSLVLLVKPELPENWQNAHRIAIACPNIPVLLDSARSCYKSLRAQSVEANIHDFRAQA